MKTRAIGGGIRVLWLLMSENVKFMLIMESARYLFFITQQPTVS